MSHPEAKLKDLAKLARPTRLLCSLRVDSRRVILSNVKDLVKLTRPIRLLRNLRV